MEYVTLGDAYLDKRLLSLFDDFVLHLANFQNVEAIDVFEDQWRHSTTKRDDAYIEVASVKDLPELHTLRRLIHRCLAVIDIAFVEPLKQIFYVLLVTRYILLTDAIRARSGAHHI